MPRRRHHGGGGSSTAQLQLQIAALQSGAPQGYPPPQGYPSQGFPPQGYPPQGYPPQGYPPQGYPPQGYPSQQSMGFNSRSSPSYNQYNSPAYSQNISRPQATHKNLIQRINCTACVCCWYNVQQSTVAIVENMGKFDHIAPPGCLCVNCFTQKVPGVISLRVQTMTLPAVVSATQDGVMMSIRVAVQFQVIPDRVSDAFYKTAQAEQTISDYVINALRSKVATMTCDQLFISRNEIRISVVDDIRNMMHSLGFEVLEVQLVDMDPAPDVKRAMNQVYTQKLLLEANTIAAETQKIERVIIAEANSEKARLEGVGLGESQKAVTAGLRGGITQLIEGVVAGDASHKKLSHDQENEIIATVLMLQYFDMMHDISSTGSVKPLSVFLPSLPQFVPKLK